MSKNFCLEEDDDFFEEFSEEGLFLSYIILSYIIY
jgi:hypothetical protein